MLLPSAASKRFIGTILNRRRYMRLIRLRLKTCELKGRRTMLDDACEYLVFHMAKPCREKGCRYHIIARLLDKAPLGPFESGAEVLAASKAIGLDFGTGMSEVELDAFIAGQSSQEVFVYRFEDATVTDTVEWDDRPGNNNSGFLPAYNSARRRVRFSVRELPAEPLPALLDREYNDASGAEVGLVCVCVCVCVCVYAGGWDETDHTAAVAWECAGGDSRGRSSVGGSATSSARLRFTQSCGRRAESRAHCSGRGNVARAASRLCPAGSSMRGLDLTRMSTAAVSRVRRMACMASVSSLPWRRKSMKSLTCDTYLAGVLLRPSRQMRSAHASTPPRWWLGGGGVCEYQSETWGMWRAATERTCVRPVSRHDGRAARTAWQSMAGCSLRSEWATCSSYSGAVGEGWT